MVIVGNNHLSENLNFFFFEEHMFSSAQSNTLSIKIKSDLDFLLSFSISLDVHFLVFVSPFHNNFEMFGLFWVFNS